MAHQGQQKTGQAWQQDPGAQGKPGDRENRGDKPAQSGQQGNQQRKGDAGAEKPKTTDEGCGCGEPPRDMDKARAGPGQNAGRSNDQDTGGDEDETGSSPRAY